MKLFTKQKLGYQEEMVGRRDRLGVWNRHVYTAIFKIDNKDLLHSIGNFAQ